MEKELEKLVKIPIGSLKFTNEQITFMNNNIGNLDSYLRDNLIYTLFSRGFGEDAFNLQQKKNIVTNFLEKKSLFKNIDKSTNDFVFLRSFNALLGSEILDYDNQSEFLTPKEREVIFDWSIKYMETEKDFRGFVPNKGWAHSIAHGSEFLGSTLRHNKFSKAKITAALNVISRILNEIEVPFRDEEESRLAYIFFLGVKANNIPEKKLTSFIVSFDNNIWKNYNSNKLKDYYRINTWLRILHHWYFFFSKYSYTQQIVKEKILIYYQNMELAF